MNTHIVQSPEWGKFKEKYGTSFVRVEGIQYFKHKIPATPFFYAYCPKVNPFSINFTKLKISLEENNCIAINFDSPNIITSDKDANKAIETFEKYCIKAPRNTFTKNSAFLDISISEEELLKGMHKKHRYNIKYATKKGVTVSFGKSEKDLEMFLDLMYKTSTRQKYFTHPKHYYQTLWEVMHKEDFFTIATAMYKEIPLASWILFTYKNVLYYPFGGSSDEYRNLQASSLLGWEAIKMGKKKGGELFDMWGIADNYEDENDPMWGFTNFKLRYGANPVTYIDSYDYVINKPMYTLFNMANDLRWTLLEVKRKL